VFRFGSFTPASSEDSAGTISEASALRAASNAGYDFPNRTAYLVLATPSGIGSGAPAMSDRLVWLVRAEGLEIRGPVPTGGGEPVPYHFAYVLVDARTGEVLMATYGV
jgi:hypothetical protein